MLAKARKMAKTRWRELGGNQRAKQLRNLLAVFLQVRVNITGRRSTWANHQLGLQQILCVNPRFIFARHDRRRRSLREPRSSIRQTAGRTNSRNGAGLSLRAV
jgi:hypothetical protein